VVRAMSKRCCGIVRDSVANDATRTSIWGRSASMLYRPQAVQFWCGGIQNECTARPVVDRRGHNCRDARRGCAGRGGGSSSLSPVALKQIAQVEDEIDRIEAQTIQRLKVPPDNEVQQAELIGKVILYDKNLSVYRNEACAFCHMPETGFTGPVSELNRLSGIYPGSVRTRFEDRKPQTHAYAALSPVLHYNPGRGDLVGGNFWDMRATGRRLGNPAAEQAEGPPTNPVEMGLPDIACAVFRASKRPYRAMFERVWGAQAFALAWPRDVRQVCARPGPPPVSDPLPVHLDPINRGRVGTTFDQMAQSIADYEASAEVTPFTSKFDAVLAGKARFATQEQEGYAP
jgi:cytochrome c peroxidase